jgi:hypothetical protein
MISRGKHIGSRALSGLALLGAMLAPLGAQALVLRADFDGNGYEDLVVGSPYEDVGAIGDAGAVSVFYGGAGGLPAEPSLQWHQDTPGVAGAPGIAGIAEANDLFGYAVVVGDFDGDGHDDLAVGVPQEGLAGIGANAGAVHVIYGSTFGLQLRRNQLVTMGRFNEVYTYFGNALAVGDFNGDGFEDLAAGAYKYPSHGETAAGAVMMFPGGPGGLSAQGILGYGYNQVPENSDHFGRALASADFDRDGFDDLAVGIPQESFGDQQFAGAVEVLYGSRTIFAAAPTRAHFLREASSSRVEAFDEFGAALTTGDFNCDGYPDLAIGHPGENSNDYNVDDGAVSIIYGGPLGVTGGVRDYWPANRAGMPGKPEKGDHLGTSLAAADFDADGCDDLAIGVPDEDQERRLNSDRPDVGHVIVLTGGTSGLKVAPGAEWHQDRSGVANGRGSRDRFGAALGVGDFNHDGVADLAVGVPGETLGNGLTITKPSAGLLHLFYGTSRGLSTAGSLGRQTFGEATSSGKASVVESGDGFGWALP